MSKITSTTITNPNGKNDTCALVQVTGQELYYLLRPIEVIGKYTISFFVKAAANETMIIHYGDVTKSFNVTTEWQRAVFSFEAKHIDNVMIQFTTGTYYIYNTQLENGNVPTDYNESPGDLQEQLAEIETTMNTQYSEVVQSLESYKVEVGKTYATQSSVNQKVSNLTLDLNGFKTSVRETYATKGGLNTVDDKISQLTLDLDGFKTEVSKTYTTQSDFQAQIDNLQQQIDGAVETFSGYDVPTLTNKPAVDWTTDKIKDTHIGDLYVVSAENTEYGGFYYRFEKVNGAYQWTLLADSEVTKALEEARKANEKADKAQKELDELVSNINTNYSTTEQMRSEINQSAEAINISVSNQITETKSYADSVASTAQSNAATDATNKANAALSSANSNTDEKLKSYATTKSVEASLELKVGRDENDQIVSMINASADEVKIEAKKIDLVGQVTAAMLTTDAIKSKNYVEEIEGSYLNLADGSFDSKNFKWDKEGNVEMIGGKIYQTIEQTFTFTSEDSNRVKEILLGNVQATLSDIDKYDLDGDGKITSKDAYYINKAISLSGGVITSTTTTILDPSDIKGQVRCTQLFNIKGSSEAVAWAKLARIANGTVYASNIRTDSGNDLDEIADNLYTYIEFSENETNQYLETLSSGTKRIKVQRFRVDFDGTNDVTIATNIHPSLVYDIRAVAYSNSTYNLFPLPNIGHSSVSSGHNNYDISLYMDASGTIHIKPYSDRTGYGALVTLYYI